MIFIPEIIFLVANTEHFNDKQWHIIQIEKLLSGNGEELRLWIDPGYHNIYSLDYFVDQITSIYTTLGSLFNSFEGYLWSLKIVNVAGSEIFITSSSCNYPSSFINCIPSCLFSEYYYFERINLNFYFWFFLDSRI